MSVHRQKRRYGLVVIIVVVVAWFAFSQFRKPAEEKSRQNDSTPITSKSRSSKHGQATPEVANSAIHFTNVASQAGVHFEYYGSPSPEAYMTEQNGGGVGLFDYDGDDRLEIFFVNGSHPDRPAVKKQHSNRLYRAATDTQYEDVTESAGLTAFGFGMGCAAADYNNDGFVDLFVAGFGRNRLWHNNGDGTFDDVTEEAGVGDDRWGSSAAFADLDGDGYLDLYVVNYLNCPGEHPAQSTCSPFTIPGQSDLLYANRANGGFENVGSGAGIELADDGKGLALGIIDVDENGKLDIYVANDTTPNFLFVNQGQFRFQENAVIKGAAVSEDGSAGSSMGVAIADFDGNGRFDFGVTNFRGEVNDLLLNHGEVGFLPMNSAWGIDAASRPALGFAVIGADFDLDAYPDLFVANGHIWDSTGKGEDYEYEMYPHLHRNNSGRRFEDVSRLSGEYFEKRRLGRSAAYGDIDNDGDTDLVVSHLKEPAAVLRNDSEISARGIRLRFIGVRAARQPLGARVEATIGTRHIVTHVPAGGSFQAANDDRVLIPVADGQTISEIRIWWPGRGVESWKNVPVSNKTVHLIEGTGSF